MRTLVAIVLTTCVTAAAVHLVDAKTAEAAIEAERFVAVDADGIVRITIDEHGLVVTDARGRDRAGICVEDDTADRFGKARIRVSPLGGNGVAFAELNDGVYDDVETGARFFRPKLDCWHSPELLIGPNDPRGLATVSPGELRLLAGPGGALTTLTPARPSLVVTAPNGRVRFRR